MISRAQAARRYYASLPKLDHQTGDIWSGLPDFGLFGGAVSGLVITPACDLANSKTPTITYVPVLSMPSLFATDFGYATLRPILTDILKKSAATSEFAEFFARGSIPDESTVKEIASIVGNKIDSAEDAVRFKNGLAALVAVARRDPTSSKLVRGTVKPKEWDKLVAAVVSNSFSDDIHFLPPEEPVYAHSAIKSASVAAFRYPLTIQCSVLDQLSRNPPSTFLDACKQVGSVFAELAEPPVKVTRLSDEFLADLLTRFARLYVRIGSADLSLDARASYAKQISEACL